MPERGAWEQPNFSSLLPNKTSMTSRTKPLFITASLLGLLLFTGCETVPATTAEQSQVKAKVYDLVELSVKPIMKFQAQPVYPTKMREDGIEGEALVSFIVTIDGETDDVHAVKATNVLFAKSAEACVQRWRFRPGKVDGKPVNTRLQVPIVFSLME
jgi:protein TonB